MDYRKAPEHQADSARAQNTTVVVILNSVAIAAQLMILGAIGLYVFGQIVYFTPFYHDEFCHVLSKAWGRPVKNTTGKTVGQPEIIRLRRKPQVLGKVSRWSYAEWLFVGMLVTGNVLVYHWGYTRRIKPTKTNASTRKRGPSAYLQIMGLNSMFNMSFLLLPVTRNSVWMELFNISYANGVKYHRWLGVLTVLTALLHSVGYFWLWIRQGIWLKRALPCFHCDVSPHAYGSGYEQWFNVFGEIALFFLLAIAGTSIPYVRRKLFNVFYYTHQLFVLALVFSIMHWSPIVWWCLPSVVIYCVERAMSSANARSPVQTQEFTIISKEVAKIVLHRSPGPAGHHHVGQFVYLNVPSISKLQWHAFTVASSAQADPSSFTVLVKALGDWTTDLVAYAEACKESHVLPTICVDGFYGASLEVYRGYETVCLVGGGIGATPIFAILEDLVARASTDEGQYTDASTAGRLRQRVVFAFSFREIELLEEILPVLLRLEELDPDRQHVRLFFYLTCSHSDAQLNQAINYDRLEGKLATPTTYAFKAGASVPPTAFARPLRSRTAQVAVTVVAVTMAVAITLFLEHADGKIKRNGRDCLWPLQQFAESAALFGVGVAVFGFVWLERRIRDRAAFVKRDDDALQPYDIVETPGARLRFSVRGCGVRTFRDLLHRFRVTVGERPDPQRLMREALLLHEESPALSLGHARIGVFVSGPDAMKREREVERGISGIGPHHFDLHVEEFNL
ncbi:hypothetical protein P43SY_001983 [Pythium insidiosum]|uniref:FAD-binding FR-type domain-containing protein n=1 Tax=Pythium insidiosum TaxID=114742 RepID=A0AAD5QAC5_PYTIN|nr:hypothetical protein P43SY_001983 [Pythium insidiosum]